VNRKDILEALDQISDARIEKAATPPRKKTGNMYWYSAIAAMLAIAILLGIFLRPKSTTPGQIYDPTWPTGRPTQPTCTTPTTPTTPTVPTWPAYNPSYISPTSPTQSNGQYSFYNLATAEFKWNQGGDMSFTNLSDELTRMQNYLSKSMGQLLKEDENVIFSPLNLYLTLSMLAESTSGETRTEILSLLGFMDQETFRQQAMDLMRCAFIYSCKFSNSLWMQNGTPYNKEVTDLLAKNYYTSVFGNDFAAAEASKPIAQWINEQTKGFLEGTTGDLSYPADTLMTVVSTLYINHQWLEIFKEEDNTEKIFHGTHGDANRTFMNKQMGTESYCYTENFGAISLGTAWGDLWLILPHTGKTPRDVLAEGEYVKLLTGGGLTKKSVKVNLSLPKFDLTCQLNMTQDLQKLGIRKLFSEDADFSVLTNAKIRMHDLCQTVRVCVNEIGITAGAYMGDFYAFEPNPPEIIDFILDRPFLFVYTDPCGTPLFAGCINNL